MRQISASNRSQNVVKIAIIDYCGFGAGLPILLSFQTVISIPNPIRKLFKKFLCIHSLLCKEYVITNLLTNESICQS